MATIHIERDHQMGMAQARQTARLWTAQAEEKFDLTCTYEEGLECDEVTFSRSGVSGTFKASKDKFEVEATLGFLFSAFKDQIESEIAGNLDKLLNTPVAPARSTT